MSNPDVFSGISDPTRRKILKMLAKRDMAIVSITKNFKISRTAINKHLKILLKTGLVERERIGRETMYMLKPDPLLEIKEWISFFDKYWDEKLQNLKNFVESGNDDK